MRTQHHLSISVPLPTNLPPSAVITALQEFIPVIRHSRALTRFEEVSAKPETIDTDVFFGSFDETVRSFEIHELINLAPGLTKEISYLSFFQHVPDGVRCRADAPAGIVVWAEYTVRPKAGPTPSPVSDGTDSTIVEDAEEYELYEASVIEANSLLMPFITQSMLDSHQALCQSLVQEVAKTTFNGFGMQ